MGIGTFILPGPPRMSATGNGRDGPQARRGGELYGLARRLGLDGDEADDAVQETLMRAWVALDERDPSTAWTRGRFGPCIVCMTPTGGAGGSGSLRTAFDPSASPCRQHRSPSG